MARELHDGFGRGINYLRISVTDKCNFRCVYCMPEKGVPARAHGELLTAEEIARFVRIVAQEGITRVRLTGGEPLVSHRIVPLIEEIRSISGIKDISLTTNGALLPRMAADLRAAGLDRVNISLDTLNPARFSQITRLGRVEQALAGIDAALEYGFTPVKVNTVVVRRMDQDVLDLARLSVGRPVHVRFIEYMPIGGGQGASAEDPSSGHGLDPHCGAGAAGTGGALNPDLWDASDVVPSTELRERISSEAAAAGLGVLEPVQNGGPLGSGPRAVTGPSPTRPAPSGSSRHVQPFRKSCNRLRLTADGTIRPCLFSDAEYPVREALRSGDEDAVRAIYRNAIARKPRQHDDIDGTQRFMSQIGG